MKFPHTKPQINNQKVDPNNLVGAFSVQSKHKAKRIKPNEIFYEQPNNESNGHQSSSVQKGIKIPMRVPSYKGKNHNHNHLNLKQNLKQPQKK
eukprot:UN17218